MIPRAALAIKRFVLRVDTGVWFNMLEALPHHLEKMRAAVSAEIEEAFAPVTRKGVSWSETKVIDLKWVSECKAERRKDKEAGWRQLVDDPNWDVFPGVGGFSFLDAFGFQYYFPVAILRCLRSGDGDWLVRSLLTLEDGDHFAGNQEAYMRRWAALDLHQRQSIRSFIGFMIALGEEPGPKPWMCSRKSRWRAALETWDRFGMQSKA